MSDFTFAHKSHVEVRAHVNDQKRHVAEIIVDGKYNHIFPATSRVSKHLDLMTAKDLSDRLTGGSFFFIGDELVDFRDGSYNGFHHTDESIERFVEVIGFQRRSELGTLHQRKRSTTSDTNTGNFVLRKVWSDHGITVPGYKEGGEFTSQLSFVWNPFNKNINSAYDLVRLICTNGMVGLTSMLNSKIPLVNRWEEHLDIASRQIQNKVSSMVSSRVQVMADQRASVNDCLLLEQHAFERLHGSGMREEGERDRLTRILAAVAPATHLQHIYQGSVFGDRTLAAQMPGHLTAFDAFNIATEIRTHSSEVNKSSDHALDRFANGLLFDRNDNFHAAAAAMKKPSLSAFSDAETAFWGHAN